MTFSVEAGRLGDQPTLVASGPGGRAVIATHGATLLSWTVDGVELVDGYRDEQELQEQNGARSAIMVPFSNRIGDARYSWDGRAHDLRPGSPDRSILHGFVRRADMRVDGQAASATSATVTMSTTIRPGQYDGYPFALDVAVELVVEDAALTLTITARNVGGSPAPYYCGWHPYLRLGTGPVDRLSLTVPAEHMIATDDKLIPLPGAAAYASLDVPEIDFRAPRPIGDRAIDTAYADLRGPTGLVDPTTGARLTVLQDRGLLHVFTGDRLRRGARRSIALEPVEVMADAINRPDLRDAITLAPGDDRVFRCGIHYEPGGSRADGWLRGASVLP